MGSGGVCHYCGKRNCVCPEPTPPAVADVWPDEAMAKEMRTDAAYLESHANQGSVAEEVSRYVDPLLTRIRELEADRQRLRAEVRGATLVLKTIPVHLKDVDLFCGQIERLRKAVGDA